MRYLLLLAVLPSLIIALLIYFSDKKEKEPIKELFKAFLLGIVSIVITIIISFVLGIGKIEIDNSNIFIVFLYSFICISLVEEFSKWICSYFFVRKNPNFNYLFDGIVYFTFISLGFATIENILYSLSGGFSTALVRAITTVPAHAFFGITGGYFYSLFRRERIKLNNGIATKYLMLSVSLPIILHGFYDFCLLTQNISLFMVYLVFIVSLYTFSIGNVKKMMRMDQSFRLENDFCENSKIIIDNSKDSSNCDCKIEE